jgi:phytoene dehydrogenase-like protein
MAGAIEGQIERFAPGFRELILGRRALRPDALEAMDGNLVGGDVNGGSPGFPQLFFRPLISARPYDTPVRGLFICSASTPPGGGVHGMCGFHAARRALKSIGVSPAPPGDGQG